MKKSKLPENTQDKIINTLKAGENNFSFGTNGEDVPVVSTKSYKDTILDYLKNLKDVFNVKKVSLFKIKEHLNEENKKQDRFQKSNLRDLEKEGVIKKTKNSYSLLKSLPKKNKNINIISINTTQKCSPYIIRRVKENPQIIEISNLILNLKTIQEYTENSNKKYSFPLACAIFDTWHDFGDKMYNEINGSKTLMWKNVRSSLQDILSIYLYGNYSKKLRNFGTNGKRKRISDEEVLMSYFDNNFKKIPEDFDVNNYIFSNIYSRNVLKKEIQFGKFK